MAIYDYEIGELFTATGTAQASPGTLDEVDGSGTAFTTEFAVGYLVLINGEYRVVNYIENDTKMQVTEAFSSSVAMAAFAGVNLINLEDLPVALFPPKSEFSEFSQQIQLGSGKVRGAGWGLARWFWGFIVGTQRDQLRLFCDDAAGDPVASNEVYIRTRNNENTDEYAYYSCVLVWPTGEEEKQLSKRIEFSLSFQDLVEIEVS